MEMMQTVRGFINLIKANPTTRDHYKTNKLANRKYDNEVNESEIKTSNLDQVQQFFNEDADVVFDALVAADYIDKSTARMAHANPQHDSQRDTTHRTTSRR